MGHHAIVAAFQTGTVGYGAQPPGVAQIAGQIRWTGADHGLRVIVLALAVVGAGVHGRVLVRVAERAELATPARVTARLPTIQTVAPAGQEVRANQAAARVGAIARTANGLLGIGATRQ